MADGDLIGASRRGEPEAMAVLVDRWLDRVFDVAEHLVGDETGAADVAAETFLAARQRGRVAQPAAFGSWLLLETRRRALDHLREERRAELRADHGNGSTGDGKAPAGAGAGRRRDVDGDSDRTALLAAADLVLGPPATSLLGLTMRHGLTATDVAGELDRAGDTAEHQLARMREMLDNAVGAWLLWRDGRPECPQLAHAVGPGATFDGEMLVVVERHRRSCEVCRSHLAAMAAPHERFAAVPVAAVPGAVRSAIAERVAAGVPVGVGAVERSMRVQRVTRLVAVGGAVALAVSVFHVAPNRSPSESAEPGAPVVVSPPDVTTTTSTTTTTTATTTSTTATTTSPATTSRTAPPTSAAQLAIASGRDRPALPTGKTPRPDAVGVTARSAASLLGWMTFLTRMLAKAARASSGPDVERGRLPDKMMPRRSADAPTSADGDEPQTTEATTSDEATASGATATTEGTAPSGATATTEASATRPPRETPPRETQPQETLPPPTTPPPTTIPPTTIPPTTPPPPTTTPPPPPPPSTTSPPPPATTRPPLLPIPIPTLFPPRPTDPPPNG